MKKHFIKLIDAEIWANKVLSDAIEKSSDPDERTLLLFSHIMSSYSMWLSRLTGTEITCSLFQERTLDESKTLMNEVFVGLKNYIENAGESEFDRIVHFVFPLDGSKKKISVSDALAHLVTHSSYHRGQIVSRLKGKIEPLPLTTYIAFAMESDE